MKKLPYLIVILLSIQVSNLQAQNLFIEGNIEFLKTHLSNSELKGVGISPKVGFFLSERFILGVGLDYERAKQTDTQTNYIIITPNPSPGSNYGRNTIIGRLISPKIFAKHLVPIVNNLNYSTNLEFGYNMLEQTTKLLMYSNGVDLYSVTTVEQNSLTMAISPELMYSLTNRIGIKAKFNGLEVATYKSWYDNKRKTDIGFNLNPSNWQFGLFLKL